MLAKVPKRIIPFVFALIASGIALVYWNISITPIDLHQINFYYKDTASQIMGLIILPGIWFAYIIYLYKSKLRPFISSKILVLVFMTVVCGIFSLCSLLTFDWSNTSHLAIIQAKDHVYRLDTFWPACLQDCSSKTALLWRCDKTGLFCTPLFYDEYFSGAAVQLVEQGKVNALEININGDTVYAYSYFNRIDSLF